jgi:hypothetical protein
VRSESQDLNMNAASDPPPPYQAQDPVPSIAPPVQRVQSTFYHVYRSYFGDYKVLLDDKTPSFYIKIRKLRTPDLIVHRGSGDYDREVANCKFPEFSNLYEMNLFREANNKSSIVQAKMTLDGHFTATVPVTDITGATINAQRLFTWKHTSGLMLIDEETSQTAAVVHSMAFGLTKCFVLETQVPYGDGFQVLLVASAMVIYENLRREYSKPSAARHGPRTGARAAAASQAGFVGLVGGSIGGGASC